MGVPKFYRWLSERYPLITQRHGVRADDELAREHFDRPPPDIIPAPDPLSTCGLPPAIDRLYIDMNGIIHGCSHNNNNAASSATDATATDDGPDDNAVNIGITEAEIFANIGYYLDRLVKEIAQPRELMYIAIDGVAPRAKLNQQRARRYRSAEQGEIERTVYDAHKQALELEQAQEEAHWNEYNYSTTTTTTSINFGNNESTQGGGDGSSSSSSRLREVEPGRFTGKFETQAPSSSVTDTAPGGRRKASSSDSNKDDEDSDDKNNNADDEYVFHSNFITPGTPFFQRCTDFLEAYLREKVAHDPAWQHLQIIYSGPNTPGEGEHKIMQFMREQKVSPQYNPNIRHCIMGQDGDLIMLGLATHEPNLMLLREQVLFDKKRRKIESLTEKYGLDLYMFNANFEFMHMNVLRDYLALEFETSNVVNTAATGSPSFDIERTVDDFVFLTFFVGNDFLPHMPALDIGDEALDLLFYTYRLARQEWHTEHEADPTNIPPPYLTHAGEIVSGKRLERFLQYVGRHESKYYAYKVETTDYDDVRKVEAKFGHVMTPSDAILAAKENADRSNYREMIRQALQTEKHVDQASAAAASFAPVMASRVRSPLSSSDNNQRTLDDEGADVEKLGKRMNNLLHISVGDNMSAAWLHDDYDPQNSGSLVIDETDFKGRYYADKFGFSPFDAENHLKLRKAYMEGLVWNLRYYYRTHQNLSWEWYYPYHYGPMISDLVDLDTLLGEISFEDRIGEPLKPFEQLLACLPASQAKLLPPPFQSLMTEESSPIREFYPDSFTVDMNGKRWPWEAVVLLPFIDSKKLRESVATVDTSELLPDELARNDISDTVVIRRDLAGDVVSIPLYKSEWGLSPAAVGEPCFQPVVHEKAVFPLDGLPTLRDGSISSMERRRIFVNVHGNRSRYQTAMLEVANEIPDLVPLEALAELIGRTIYINYPSLIEAFVTAVSDSKMCIRGSEPPKLWDSRESALRSERVSRILNSYRRGLALTGTGGLTTPRGDDNVDDTETLLYVRPFKGLKTLDDGTVVKTFARYQIEVPLFVLSWAPVEIDKRLKDIPMQIEKDPYNAAKRILTDTQPTQEKSIPRISPLRDMFPGDGPAESGAMNRLLRSRGFTSLARPPGRNSRGLCTFAHVATPSPVFNQKRFGTQTYLRRLPTSPKGGMFVACLVVMASVFGFQPVQGSSYYSGASTWPTGLFSNQIDQDQHEAHMASLTGPVSSRQTPPLDFLHGTTTLSFKYQGGIVAAVDSRASLGNYIGSKTTQKVLPINKSMLGTMAGGAADCMFWIRRLAAEAALHEVSWEGRRMSVARASRLLANSLYQYRGANLSVGTMIMGFDSAEENSPPRIFYVDNSGMRIEGDMFAVGSGSTYAQGILDTERRYDMTDEEAISLGLKAIRHATFRDSGSGGFINVYLIKRDGWIHVFRQDLAAVQPTMDEDDT